MNRGVPTPPRSKPGGSIDYFVMFFLILTPIIGVAGTAVYTYFTGFALWMPLLAVAMYLAVGMSICAGYHRFFSHKSYEASRPVQLFYAVFGAMAAQNSILWWSSSHRNHHQYVDRDWDPAKWFIATLRMTGLAGDLRSATPPQVEHARMDAELRNLEPRLAAAPAHLSENIGRLIADARAHLDSATALWRQHVVDGYSRAARRKARGHIREARRRWSYARVLALAIA